MEIQKSIASMSQRGTRIVLALLFLAAPMLAAAQSVKAPIYTILHKFTGGADGSESRAGVIGDAAGNIYGTTQIGGPASRNCGTVKSEAFEIFKIACNEA